MRTPQLVALLAIAVGSVACAGETDIRAELCRDMGNLAATVEALATTADDGRIGTVRGDLEKLDPTFGHVSRSGLVDDSILQPLLRAHVGYRDAIWDLGDDETYLAVPPQVRARADDLATAYAGVLEALGCQLARSAGSSDGSVSATEPGM
jgi:hypothetical protein